MLWICWFLYLVLSIFMKSFLMCWRVNFFVDMVFFRNFFKLFKLVMFFSVSCFWFVFFVGCDFKLEISVFIVKVVFLVVFVLVVNLLICLSSLFMVFGGFGFSEFFLDFFFLSNLVVLVFLDCLDCERMVFLLFFFVIVFFMVLVILDVLDLGAVFLLVLMRSTKDVARLVLERTFVLVFVFDLIFGVLVIIVFFFICV